MKTIGMIGGMSWESTAEYYALINEAVKGALGGYHSAKCILHSVDFHEVEACQSAGEWDKVGDMLANAAQGLERAGADFIILCTNTMHKVLPQIQARVSIPILHIADALAKVLKENGITKVALLGTRYTMEQDFYIARIKSHGINVLVPEKEDRDFINRVIFEELCQGILRPASRERYVRIIEELYALGAQGAVLGCTEIGLLVKQTDTNIPLFDTTRIHAQMAVRLALQCDQADFSALT